MTPAQLELHRQSYVNDPGRNFLSALMDGLRDYESGLAWHLRYEDFSFKRSMSKADQWESYFNTIRTVLCEVKTIANGEIGTRRALVSQFRVDRKGNIPQEHFSVRFELVDSKGRITRAQRFAFQWDEVWIGHPDQMTNAAKMVIEVEDKLIAFLMSGAAVPPLVIQGHFEFI